MTKQQKRKKIIESTIALMNKLDPDKDNAAYWKKKLEAMSEKEFATFMDGITSSASKEQFYLLKPNVEKNLELEDLVDILEGMGQKYTHRIWFVDEVTGIKYLSKYEYPIVQVPVRRAQQFWSKKARLPESDTTISGLDDQVTGKDKAASLSRPELLALFDRKLDNTCAELLRVRGGDQTAYSDFKRQIEETGEGELGMLSDATGAKSPIMTQVFFKAIHIGSNFQKDIS